MYKRDNTLLTGTSAPSYAGSYQVNVYPVGGIAAAVSSGSTATLNAPHSFRVGDKCLIRPGSDNQMTGAIAAVTATTIDFGSDTFTFAVGDEIVNLGQDTGGGSAGPNYDGSSMAIYSDPDGGNALTNAKVTANSQGRYEYHYHGDGKAWELIRDASGTVVSLIPGFDAVPGRLNIADFGAKLDGSTDESPALAAAIMAVGSEPHAIHLGAGTHTFRSTTNLTDDLTITTDGEQTIIQGFAGTETLFSVGGVDRLTWTGGKFQNASVCFSGQGSGLAQSRFIDMRFVGTAADDIGKAFSLTSANNNEWRNCDFGSDGDADNIQTAFDLLGTDTAGYVFNVWENCDFRRFKTGAITLSTSATTNNCFGNSVKRCRFFQSDGHAIQLANTVVHWLIEDCLFNDVGDATDAAIIINAGTDIIKRVFVERCYFTAPATGMTEWIATTGNAQVTARDNHVVINATAVTFLKTNSNSSAAPSPHLLENNYITPTGTTPTYETGLFDNAAGQEVNYTVCDMVSGTTGDDKRHRIQHAKIVSPTITSFADGDATPDVSAGEKIFQTANTSLTTITDFDGGRTGEQIIVLVQDALTAFDFSASSLKGNAGVDWSAGNGDWLTAVYDGTSWYCDIVDTTP